MFPIFDEKETDGEYVSTEKPFVAKTMPAENAPRHTLPREERRIACRVVLFLKKNAGKPRTARYSPHVSECDNTNSSGEEYRIKHYPKELSVREVGG